MALYALVDARAGEVLERVWTASGVAQWSSLETILLHVADQFDESNLPNWWPNDLPKRRGRGDVEDDYVPVFASVLPDAANVLTRIKDASGVGKNIALEAILHWVGAQLDPNGLPSWWPAPTFQQEALISA